MCIIITWRAQDRKLTPALVRFNYWVNLVERPLGATLDSRYRGMTTSVMPAEAGIQANTAAPKS